MKYSTLKRLLLIAILGITLQWQVMGQAGMLKPIPVKDQYKKALPPMMLLAQSIQDYLMDMEHPPKAESIRELLNHDFGIGLTFAQFYLDEIPEELVPFQDIWGNDFIYHLDGDRFYLASAGSDGKFEGFQQQGIYAFDREIAGKDIIYSNDGFILFPATQDQRWLAFELFKIRMNILLPIAGI